MAEFAPIGMTLDEGVVKGTRQPGQPGRPRSAAPESGGQEEAVPLLQEAAHDAWSQGDHYYSPSYARDPSYRLSRDYDGALNATRDAPVGVAFGSSLFRSLRSWSRMTGALAPEITPDEWLQVRGARNLPDEPPRMSYVEAALWAQKYDADMIMERIHRQGRNPWVQSLVGGIAGGLVDPVNVGITVLSGGIGTAVRGAAAAIGAASGGALKSAAVAQFGARMARHSAAVAGVRIFGEATAAVPFELAVADRYGEEYGIGDFAAEVGVAGALSLLSAGVGRAMRNTRLTVSEDITARARAESEATGNPDSDLVTVPEVEKALDPTPLDDMPVDKGKAPPPPEFRPAMMDTWESGLDDPEWSKAEARVRRTVGAQRDALSDVQVRAREAWAEVTDFEQVAERLSSSGNEMSVPAAKAVIRQSVASRLAPLTDQVRKQVRNWTKQSAKTPKGLLDRPGRFGIFVRENNITTPRIRTLVAEVLETAGMPRKNAEGLSSGLTRDEAAAWVDTFITTATREEYRIPDAVRPLVGEDMAVIAALDQIDAVQATRSRPERAAHFALEDIAWNGADSRTMRRLENWLRQTGVLVPGSPDVRPVLRRAAADYSAAVRQDPNAHPFDFIEQALQDEGAIYAPVDMPTPLPAERARAVVEARERGDVVSPDDVVPLRDMAGRSEVGGPDTARQYRALADEAVETGKIGDMMIDEVDRAQLADLTTSIDELSAALGKCMR